MPHRRPARPADSRMSPPGVLHGTVESALRRSARVEGGHGRRDVRPRSDRASAPTEPASSRSTAACSCLREGSRRISRWPPSSPCVVRREPRDVGHLGRHRCRGGAPAAVDQCVPRDRRDGCSRRARARTLQAAHRRLLEVAGPRWRRPRFSQGRIDSTGWISSPTSAYGSAADRRLERWRRALRGRPCIGFLAVLSRRLESGDRSCSTPPISAAAGPRCSKASRWHVRGLTVAVGVVTVAVQHRRRTAAADRDRVLPASAARDGR